MEFELLSETEFSEFAAKSPYRSFLQTCEIARLREKSGWTPYYFGVRRDGVLVAAAMMVAKRTFLGKSTYFCPGGPLVDLADRDVTEFLLSNLKKYARAHGGFVITMTPYYEVVERGRDGAPLEGGFDHSGALSNLRAAGFREVKSEQPKYLFALEIKGRTAEELFASFKSNTRGHIRKAEKLGVKVRELKRAELTILKKITEATGARRGFDDKPLSYYEEMYDLFHDRGEVKFVVAEAEGKALSAAMFMLYGDEVVYLFSGSDEKYMKEYNAQYLIQWEMIKYAAENGFARYNFYGIHGLPSSGEEDGIYGFKKGFTSEETGRVVELAGTWSAAVSPLWAGVHKVVRGIRG